MFKTFFSTEVPKKKHGHPEIIEEKREEMRRSKEYETVDQVGQTPDMQGIPSRWVITEKDGGKFKARLVVRGFEEPVYPQSDSTHPQQAGSHLRLSWLSLQMKVSKYKIWTLRVQFCREHHWKDKFLWSLPRNIKDLELSRS